MPMLVPPSVWELHVDRGPNWLLVKAARRGRNVSPEASLAKALWDLMEAQFAYRVVLELEASEPLTSELIQQLASLDEQARAHNGCVRLCGLPRSQRRRLRHTGDSRVFDLLPLYENRQDAVFGHRGTRSREHGRKDWATQSPLVEPATEKRA
jgi:anti-anti-sigma regulatory factor